MDSYDRGPQVQAVTILFLALAWISVSLRCYVRIFLSRLFRIDDWLSVLTLVVFTVYCGFVLAGEYYGTGQHKQNLLQEDFQLSMMWWYCGEITYVLTTCLVKVYIGVFLMQICIYKSQLIVIWTVIVTFSTFTVYYLFLMILQCHPISYFWMQHNSEVSGYCISTNVIAGSTYAHGALSAIADWTLGILPIFLVWNLNMNPRTKLSVALILALGAVGSTATIIRIPFINALRENEDFLYKNTDVAIWSTVEPGMGITASSIACLRPLFQAFLSRSRIIGSSKRDTLAWNASRVGYVRSKNKNGVEELRLHDNPAKTIRVTTVINTHSARDNGDLEMALDLEQERSTPARELRGKNGWDMK